ncbi:MAG: TonB-dependent receptor [Sphingomonas sp.]
MITKNFKYSRTLALASVAGIALMPLAAHAQAAAAAPTADQAPTADEPQVGLADIIVTAQKRSENNQTTPIAISVLSEAALADRHVQSLGDLGDGAIPSLRIAPFFSRPGALIINVRGIGVLADSNQPGRDQGVGVYVDGVYLGRPQGLGTALYDVENIEVLKGPQGTLFGRNTEGGALNIVTKRPSGKFKANTTFGFGNYGSYQASTHIDLPEFANISAKFDGVITFRGGQVDNPLSGQLDFNSYDKRGLRFELLWKPATNFRADFAVDNSYDATSTLYLQLLSPGAGLPASATAAAIPANRLGNVPNLVQPRRASSAPIGVPQEASVGRNQGYSLVLEWDALSALTVKTITAYRALTQTQFDNGSATGTLQTPPTTANPTASFLLATGGGPYQFARYSLAPTRQNQFSQEIQAIGEIGRVKFVGGALYFLENVEDSAQAFNTLQSTAADGSTFVLRQINFATQVVARASHVTTTSIGVYGQGIYTPPIANDIFHLTLGGRYTNDKKNGVLFTINSALPVLPVNGVNVVGPINRNITTSRFDPLVNLALDVSDDVHIYGKWNTGYRSGGANSRSLNYSSFNPESVSIFEIGAKTELLNHRVRLNLAAYTGAYKGIQLDYSGLYEDIVNGVRVATTRTTTDTVNAPGTGRVRGVEAELAVNPLQGLTLTASYAYNSVSIPDTINPFPLAGNNSQVLQVPIRVYQVYTPDHAASGSVDYEVPFNGFKVRAHIDGNYDSGYFVNYNDPVIDARTGAIRFAQPKGDPGFVVNGRLTVADIALGESNARLGVAVWVRNLFNEEHVFYRSATPGAGASGFFNDFRTFGLEANIKL